MKREQLNELALEVLRSYSEPVFGKPKGFTKFYSVMSGPHNQMSAFTSFMDIDWSTSRFLPLARKCAKIVVEDLLSDEEKNDKMNFKKGILFILGQDIDRKLLAGMVTCAEVMRQVKVLGKHSKYTRELLDKAVESIDNSEAKPEIVLGAMEIYRYVSRMK